MKKENHGHFFNKFDDEDDKHQEDDEDDKEHRSKSKIWHYHQLKENNDELENGEFPKDMSVLNYENFAKKHSKLLQCHPLKVDLTLRFRHYQLLITYTYYSKLGMLI